MADRGIRARAAAAMGLAPPALIAKAKAGAVFIVRDEGKAIDFPAERVEGAPPRTTHPGRPVIIVQTRLQCTTAKPNTLLVVPCSSSHHGDVGPWDLELPSGEEAFNMPRVVAYASLVQPILKSDLDRHLGDLSAQTLVRLQGILLANLGIASSAPANVQAPPRAGQGTTDS